MYWLTRTIGREQETIDKKQEARVAIREKIDRLGSQQDLALQMRAHKALEYKEKVEAIRSCHEALLEAEIRLIEAQSDVETLEERNSGIVQRQEQERQQVKEIEKQSKIVTDKARKALAVCQAITAEEDEATNERLQGIPEDLTLEALELDIASEESKLDFIQASNPNAIAQFERFQQTVERLTAQVEEADERLKNIQQKIAKVRGKWEPELDKLISEISDAFAYNFEQIGCAGEVEIEKTDDFDDWAIKIKVKFRYVSALAIAVLEQMLTASTEKTNNSKSSTSTVNPAASDPFRPSSTSWPCNPSPDHPSV